LKSLGLDSADAAEDGPAADILDALLLTGEADAAPIIEATRRIGRLVEMLDAVLAAKALSRRAETASREAYNVGRLTVEQANSGDRAINDWIAAMMSLYQKITGKEPATSVGKTGQPNEGVAAGPLIRFLAAAGEPVGLQLSEDAWRSRVRAVLKGARQDWVVSREVV
jgi:hypothetical protein